MNKNAGILLVVLIALIASAVLYFTKGSMDGSKIAGLTSVKGGIQKIIDIVEPDGDSVIAKLNNNILGVVDLSIPNFKPVSAWLEDVQKQLSNTAAWKRLNLDQMLNLGSGGLVQKLEAELKPAFDQLGPAGEILYSALVDVDRVVLALSNENFQLEGAPYPKVLVSLNFKDEGHSKQLYQQFDQIAQQAKRAKIEKIGDTGYSLLLTNPKNANEKIEAILNSDSHSVVAMIGTNDQGTFIANDGAAKLVKSESWKSIGAGVLPSAAITYYLNTENATNAIVNILSQPMFQTKDFDLKQLEEQLTASWSGIQHFAGSMNFSKGMHSRQCTQVESSSALSESYEALLQAKQSATNTPLVSRLVNQNTIVALRLSTGMLEMGLSYLKDGKLNLGQGGGADSPDMKKLQELFNLVLTKTERLGFRELGLVLNAPTLGLQPTGGILLGGGKLAGKDALTELQNLITESLTVMGQDPSMLPLQLDTGSDGQPILRAPTPAGMSLIFVPTAENSIIATIDPTYSTAVDKELSENGSGYLGSIKASEGNVNDIFNQSDYTFYLNTKPALNMARPFLPLLNQNPAMQLEMNEIEELVSMLEATVLGTQNTYQSSEVICTDGSLVVIQ